MSSGADRQAASAARHSSVEDYCERIGAGGVIPPPRNPLRRQLAEADLPLWLRTYLPSVYTRQWCDASLRYLADIVATIADGTHKCVAMPRGMGKTAMAVGAALWAAITGQRRYIVLVGATAPLANRMIADIAAHLQSEIIAEDYPEVAIPVMALEGKAQRCRAQTYGGEPTLIEMRSDYITLPTLSGIASPSAGVTLQAAGLTGAVRGLHRIDSAGRWQRPDYVLLDDPQTRDSARSLSQTDEREQIILGDVLGLAGHGQAIGAVMACTVIEQGDLSERFLSADRHGDWRGQREPIVTAWGDDAIYSAYDDAYRSELAGLSPAGTATAIWRDLAIDSTSPARPLDETLHSATEASALQHARNLYLSVGEIAFAAEYLQRPISRSPSSPYTLRATHILARATGAERGAIPTGTIATIAAIDINRYALAWCVLCRTISGELRVIDYGWWRRATGDVWADGEPRQQCIATGITALVDGLLRRPYGDAITGIAIDSGYETSTIYSLMAPLRQAHPRRIIVPARGVPGDKYRLPSTSAIYARGEECDVRWIASAGDANERGLLLTWDSHHWHMSTQRGWLTAIGSAGSVTIYGQPAEHTAYADQASADELQSVTLSPYGREVATWSTNRHNEMGDVLAMAAAMASLGQSIVPTSPARLPSAAEAKRNASTPAPSYHRRRGSSSWITRY